jgi:uncharacterized repeat protein (TIGR01451 family)
MKPYSLVLRVILALALAAGWILLPGASPVQAATCTWDGSVGNWSETVHWSCGIAPGSDDTAIINAGAVNLYGDVTVQGLVLSGGALEGSSSIIVTEVMTWTGGTMRGTGTTTIGSGAGLSLSGVSAKYLDERTLDNQGAITVTGTGNFQLQNGASVSNAGSFDLQKDADIMESGGTAPTFNNTGLFRKSGESGTSVVAVDFDNSGTVEAQSGRLWLSGGGDHTGAFTVTLGATLQFGGGDHTLAGSTTVAGAGEVAFSSGTNYISVAITNLSGLLTVSGGTLNLNGPATIPAVSLSGGVLQGTSTLTVTEVMTWTANTMGGSGKTVIAPGAGLNLSGADPKSLVMRTLDNRGTLSMAGTGNLDVLNGVTLSNTGTFDLQVDQNIIFGGGSDCTFNNMGLFRKSGEGGLSNLQIAFNNDGTVEAQSGTLQLSGGGDHSGTFAVSAGAALEFSDLAHTLDASATIAGAGDVTFSGGTHTVDGTIADLGGLLILFDSALFLNGPASVSAVSMSGYLEGSSTLTVTEMMTWTGGTMGGSGTTVIAPGAGLSLSGTSDKYLDARTLENQGTATIGGYFFYLRNGAVVSNTGTFDLQVDRNIGHGGGAEPTFNNAGTFRESGGSGTSYVQVLFNNSGTVEAQSGRLRLQRDGEHSGTFDVSAGADLEFGGGVHTLETGAIIAGAGDVIVSGGTANFGDAASMVCGNFAHSGGTLNMGDISIAGDLTRTGGAFNAGSSTVTFNGGTTQTLGLSLGTNFYNLAVASGTTLIETASSDYATVSGELINQGVIRKTQPIIVSGNKTFGLTGAALNVTSTGGLNSVQVDQVGADHPHATPGATGGRYWTVTPSGANYTVDLTLPHTGVPADVQVCRYTGGDWDCAQTSATATTVTRWTITQLSDWVVADASTGVDLALDKAAAPTSLPLGEGLTYTLAVENEGGLAATGVTISDTLPPDLTYGSAIPSQGACAQAGGVVSCTLGALPPASPLVSSTFDAGDEGWTTYGDAEAPVYNGSGGSPGGHICATDRNTSETWYFQAPSKFHGDLSAAYNQRLTFNLEQSITTSQYDAADVFLIGGSGLTLRYDTSYNPGATWTFYRVPLHESGWVNTVSSQPATQAEMTSVLADLIGLRIRGDFYVNLGAACLDSVKIYNPADVVMVTLAVTPTAGGPITNTAEVAANEAELDLEDNVDQAGVLVVTSGTIDLSVNKSASPDPAIMGDPLTYTVGVANSGFGDATGVILTDTLPLSVTFVSATSSPAICGEMGSFLTDTNSFACPLGGLGSGDTAVVTLTVTVDPDVTGTLTNTAVVTATETDYRPSNNAVTITTAIVGPEMLARVVLLGPLQGYTGIAYPFTAIITPADLASPITYTWSPPPGAGAGTAVATYTWSTSGTYPITVWAEDNYTTVSDTHTVAISPPPAPASGDAYEEDDTCGAAKSVLIGGAAQVHTFHDQGDEDWVSFTATAGITYVVEARVPSSSTADLTLALYDTCGGAILDGQDATFSPDVRLVFTAPASGSYYLQLSNDNPALYGAQVAYHLSVRAFETVSASGALVIVAGRLKEDDPLQANIRHVTTEIFRLARANGCTGEQIYYLATDPTIDADGDGVADVDALSTKANLEQAITEWAAGRVGPDQPFTLYLMDHGGYDKFYLDGQTEMLTPADLDGWLTDLETATGVQASVIVEACHSGSFIDPVQTVSQDGRVVIASTGPNALAYASQTGASFSDALLNALGQGLGLGMAFEEGRWAAGQGHPDQTAWLDGNGNGAPNEAGDAQEAALHAFACAGEPQPDQMSPHIVQVNVTRVGGGMVEIWAQVEDDESVKWAWAVVYTPSYPEPVPGEEFRTEPLPVTLQPRGYDWYGGLHASFQESGEYRIVVYAQDEDGLDARPKEFRLQVVSWPVYLPVVMRQN